MNADQDKSTAQNNQKESSYNSQPAKKDADSLHPMSTAQNSSSAAGGAPSSKPASQQKVNEALSTIRPQHDSEDTKMKAKSSKSARPTGTQTPDPKENMKKDDKKDQSHSAAV